MQQRHAGILDSPWARLLVVIFPYGWLLLFFLIPFLIVCGISIAETEDGIVFKLMGWEDSKFTLVANFGRFIFLFSDPLYINVYVSSLKFSGLTTLACLIIGYPFAYFMAKAKAEYRPALLMLVMTPFWTSFLLRIYAWKILLAKEGFFNTILIFFGVIQDPIALLNTPFSLTIGMVYAYFPLMVLPLYAHFVKMDLRLLEAAADLGARPFTAFLRVTVPLSKNGIIAGCLLVFIPCLGEYVIPELLGGPETLMIGRVLWDEFFNNNDWPMASAVAVMMILLIILPLAIYNSYQGKVNESEVSS